MSKIRAAAEMMKNLPGLKVTGKPRDLLEEAQLRQLKESMAMSLPGRGSLRPLGAVPRDLSKGEMLGITTAMGGLGGLGVSDLTEGFTESAKLSNSIFLDPEELGRQAAKAKMTLQEIMDKARGKAEELGESSQIYMLKIQSGYQDEMNNQQMQEPQRIYDEDQGMKPVSLFMADGDEVKKQFPNPGLEALYESGEKGRDAVEAMGYQEGGEAIDDDLESMQMSEEDAMNQMNQLTQSPEVQMIEQLIGVVQQLMAQGVSEEEIKMFLKEQGLDDEDIEALFEMIADSGMQQEQGGDIDQQLQGMM